MSEQKTPFSVGNEVRYIGSFTPEFLNRKATITKLVKVATSYVGAHIVFDDGGMEPMGWFPWRDLEAWQDADHTDHVHVTVPSEDADWGKVIEMQDLKTPAIQAVLDELRALTNQKLVNAHLLSQYMANQDQMIAQAEHNLQLAIHNFLADGNQPVNYKLFTEQSDCIEALSIVFEARQ